MLFARQRLLLTLLEALGGEVTLTDFQKLLFLYTHECEPVATYEFVPYRFGGFSFTSYADKRRLTDAGFLREDDHHWRLTERGRDASSAANPAPQIEQFCRQNASLRGNALVAEVYRRFPYYAIRSEILDKVPLSGLDRARIREARPVPQLPALLTIGYEGKSLEGYLNQLLRAAVTLLCDVRRNPLSRKYGFSKSTLKKACEGVGIRYEHLPELGIASDQRRALKTREDYEILFRHYETECLPQQSQVLATILRWIEVDRVRVALTCFEALPNQCHRHCVAEELQRKRQRKSLTIAHL